MNESIKKMLFIYTETPLHAGSGRSLGYVDLPIQRERVTDYPMIQSSGVKGALRNEIRFSDKKYHRYEKDKDGVTRVVDTSELMAIFGAADDTENGQNKSYAGAVTVGDARLLLFPVRSLEGVFAWVTSIDVFSRFKRDAMALGITIPWQLPAEPQIGSDTTECWAGQKVGFDTKNGRQVTLEDFTYTAKKDEANIIHTIGTWLAQNALPQTGEYNYWRESLPNHLVILRREDFRDFARYGTEVRTHIKIAPDTKTVESGALWTTESLPTDTLLYTPLIINDSRAQVESKQSAREIETELQRLHDTRINLGGDETTGHGVVMLHFSEVKNG
jgi:CRISPR-associated protein Cmr4